MLSINQVLNWHTYLAYVTGLKWVTPVDPFDPLNNVDVTHILPTCDPHVEVFFLKVAKVT